MKFLIIFTTRFISCFTGVVANLRLPAFINQFVIARYVKAYKVDVTEIEKPISAYESLGKFFIRNLEETARPLAKGVLCSPIDGTLRSSGQVGSDVPVLVKGQKFGWEDFLLCPNLWQEYNNGTFFNFYLSPKDYHHVHFPLAGRVSEVIHHPGGLLPVNDWSINRFPNLFCFNERVVAIVEGQNFKFLVIMIGALNVGSIELEFDRGFRRSFFELKTKRQAVTPSKLSNLGDRFGTFRLGSSVICVFPPGVISKVTEADHSIVKYGAQIAELS